MVDKKEFGYAWVVALIFLIFAAWFGWHLYHKNILPEKEPTEAEIDVVSVVEKTIAVENKYIGYVTPINDVDVQPYISGFINEVLVEGGQEVRVGQKLVIIDQEQYKAALDAANASLNKATADFNYAKNYYERIKKAGLKAVSQTETDNAESSFLASQAILHQAKANVKQAEVNLGYTVINSTIDGVVGNVALTKGDYISPQNKLFSIVQTNPIRVVFSISDKDYLEENAKEKMFNDERIRLKLADGSIYDYEGVFKYSDNQIDRATNSIAVYVDFENPQQKLIDKAYVTVMIEKDYKGILINKDLVTLQSENSFVYVSEGNLIKKHNVKILAESGNNYVLENNFLPTMKLVAEKINLQSDNQKVKINEIRNEKENK
ncbi:MAG: efflux RND transporter periplasmic adaptor subunit [Alphaproteobacteria bacterium]|nr:efflux RND transporter periplasmic adaptor subunit [Alphaproteobacteria bacterium]